MLTTGRLLNLIYKSNKASRGILEIWPPDTEKDETRDRIFASGGISIIHYCEAQRCCEDADRIVQEFLDILNQG